MTLTANVQDNDNLTTITQSSIGGFRRCHRFYRYRYEDQLERTGEDVLPLWFGDIFHRLLETWFLRRKELGDTMHPGHNDFALRAVEGVRDELLRMVLELVAPGREDSEHHRTLFEEMVKAYIQRWGLGLGPDTGQVTDGMFDVIDVEMPFRVPITNPETGAQSRSFVFRGKADGLVRLRSDGRLYILEHKTLGNVGELARLWTDFQTLAYAEAIGELLGEVVVGSIYDIIIKPRIRRKVETHEAFEKRLSGCKRPETIEKHRASGPKVESFMDYRKRLQDFFAKPDNLHREVIHFRDEDRADFRADLWDQTKQILETRRRGRWMKNTGQCYAWQRECSFAPLCQNGGQFDEITMNWFDVRDNVHPELVARELGEQRVNEPLAF